MYKLWNWFHNIIRGGMRLKKTYTILIHKEEGKYWAECPELEGCFAQADTIEELKRLMEESIFLYYSDSETNKKDIKKDIKLNYSYA